MQGSNPTTRQRALLERIRVNAPARMLDEGLIDRLVRLRVHPEIGLDARILDKMGGGRLKRLARKIEAGGLRPSAHGPFFDLCPGASDPRILDVTRKRLGRALETAAWFEPAHIVYHPDYEEIRHAGRYSEWLETSIETWRPLARRARELGILLVLENTYESGPDPLAPLLAELAPEGVGFCFDVGHSLAFGRTPLLEWLDLLGPYLSALHLHDNPGGRDDHLPIGAGRVDFPGLFAWLAGRDRNDWAVTLEPHREEDIWPSLAALSGLWPWDLP
ncbi:MAG: sugar phosphate isomerase/epimerase [Proteobacteria bacterium]|nr:sugar phosphate isomerase/epimerase [Pseudomonadota bacterium]